MAKAEYVSISRAAAQRTILEMYELLWAAYGPQHWWPAKTATEVVVGAILTQKTAWKNVERAIDNLRAADCLTWKAMHGLSARRLAELIRPAGTYQIKAARLKAFVEVLWTDHRGSLRSLLDGDLDEARVRLLAIHGIGPETADAILLYAGERPIFVVDAYTRRILRRHRIVAENADYDAVQRLFHDSLPNDTQLYNEYHALLVAAGKQHCRARARCDGCPLESLPHDSSP